MKKTYRGLLCRKDFLFFSEDYRSPNRDIKSRTSNCHITVKSLLFIVIVMRDSSILLQVLLICLLHVFLICKFKH